LADTEPQSKMGESVKEKKVQKRYDEEFKRQAVELVIHSGKTQAQIARELGVSEYSLTLWKKDYLRHVKPGQLDGEQMSPEEMLEKIRQQQSEIEYLKRQREILKKAMSILGEEPLCGSSPSMLMAFFKISRWRLRYSI
jgi:transposase